MSYAREQILAAIKTRIENQFGPKTSRSFLRGVNAGPWRPKSAVRPVLWVHDAGQRKAMPAGDGEEAKQYVLSVQLIMDLQVDWERAAEATKWTSRVEEIWRHIQNWLPPHGCIRMDYTGDEPLDLVLSSGEMQSVWVVEFEAEYFDETGNLGRS